MSCGVLHWRSYVLMTFYIVTDFSSSKFTVKAKSKTILTVGHEFYDLLCTFLEEASNFYI